MTSFEFDIGEQERVSSEFLADVVSEIQRAIATEKGSRKLTQQGIAQKIGTSRAVINRQVQGLENLSARRIAEILWAIGWEPYFRARKRPATNHVAQETSKEEVCTTAATAFGELTANAGAAQRQTHAQAA